MLTDLFPIYVSVVTKVFCNYSLCLDEGGAERSLAQDTSAANAAGVV